MVKVTQLRLPFKLLKQNNKDEFDKGGNFSPCRV